MAITADGSSVAAVTLLDAFVVLAVYAKVSGSKVGLNVNAPIVSEERLLSTMLFLLKLPRSSCL